MKKNQIIFLAFLILPLTSSRNSKLYNLLRYPASFVKEVNEVLLKIEGKEFLIDNIKDKKILYDESKNEFLYLGFKHQGYLLINNNLEIERYEFGNLLDLKSISYIDKSFLNKTDIVYTFNNNSQFEYSSARSTSIVEYNDLLSYMTNRTGNSNLTIVDEGKLHGLSSECSNEGLQQLEQSVFIQAGTGNSEGNCGIVSVGNVIKYYSRYKDKINLPHYSSTTIIKPYEEIPSIYPLANSNGYIPKSDEVEISTIVASVRKHAIDKGYVTGGMNDELTSYSFIETCKDYNYFNSSFNGLNNYSVDLIKEEINNNRPLQLRTNGDQVYGGHGMMITGYKTFKYSRRVNMMVLNVNITAVSVFDGHSKNERWVDLNIPSSVTGIPNRADSMSIALMDIK